MIPLELMFYAGVGAVAALLAFVALLLVALVLPDLKHSAWNVVIPNTFFLLCGVGLMAVLRLSRGVWQVRRPWHKLLLAGMAGIVVLLILLGLPCFIPARASGARNACMAKV